MQFFVSVTLLGMRTLAVEKLTFKEALQQPFEGYCAEAPDAQRSGFPEPPPVHLLRDLGTFGDTPRHLFHEANHYINIIDMRLHSGAQEE